MIELRSILGLTNLYQWFVMGFSHISWALIQGTKGGMKNKFVWSMPQQKSFEDLKFSRYSTPLIILPNLQQPFEIEIDDSDYAIGAVLTQHGNSVAYHNENIYEVV
jgi:hypothetical protein